MPKVSIKEDGNKRTGLSVYIDDRFAFNIEKEDYIKSELYGRDEVSEEELQAAGTFLNYTSAKKAAVRMAVSRLQPEAAIERKLKTKGYDDDIIRKAINDLLNLGYIDDLKYARMFIKDKMILKPLPRYQLQMLLHKNGIDREVAKIVLDEIDINEDDLALKYLKKKFKHIPADEKDQMKAVRYLKSKGFSTETVFHVLRDSSF